MAEAFIKVLVQVVTSLLQKESRLLSGVEKDVESLSSKLSTIRNFLEDAEERQFTDKAVDDWLRKLKNVAYDVDDVLDEFKTEVERLEDKRSSTNKVRASLTKLNPKIPIFRHKIGSQLKQLQEKLDGIVKEGNDFHLQARIANRPRAEGVIQGRITGYLVNENEVRGREEDREKVVECLLKDAANSKDIFVYPIVGMGGLGKTTLAQLVFNDDRIKRHFEKQVWVCVPEKSPQNDFDVKSVISAIVESLSEKRSEVSDLASLQTSLQKLLNGKRYLLVLDDVWNDNIRAWEELKCALSCGSNGASVIVTTRLDTVAKIMGTFRQHNLSILSDDDCSLLFKQRAFEPDATINQNITSIAREIVKKCKGVPLVAKTLGGFLRSTSSESEWKKVRDSDLWRLSDVENSVLPILRLSYWNLPSEEKQCFAYCAIFHKDSTIMTEELIRLWMANGFLSSSGTLEMEDVGSRICKELAVRSLIQVLYTDGSGHILSFKMHDLIHDLAHSVMKNEFCASKDGHETNVPSGTHHLVFHDVTYRERVNLEALGGGETLRTLLLPKYAEIVNFDDISKFHSLRALVANDLLGITNLPYSIGNLKHLRQLDISGTKIEVLPDSICSLWNLLILNLKYCPDLRALPDYLRRLRNLRHLLLYEFCKLTSMPPNLGKMKGLKTLSLFIVDRRKGCHITELKSLKLGGKFCIKNLERVGGPMDAKEANLGKKENLLALVLCWKSDCEGDNWRQEFDSEILEALEPHPNLQRLDIKGYQGVQMPHWWTSSVLDNIVSITFTDLKNILNLPLERLPNLRDLNLFRLPCLERLSIEEGREMLQSLTSVTVSECPKFTLPYLPSVTKLEVLYGSKVLLTSISNLNNLKELEICYLVRSLPDEMFIELSSLKSLNIGYCFELDSLPEQGLQTLKSLESLTFTSCKNLKSLPNGLQYLSALQSLCIDHCFELEDFPDVFQHLVSLRKVTLVGDHVSSGRTKLETLPEALKKVPTLEHLTIAHYDNWTSLPEWLGSLTSLQHLSIHSCKSLSSLPTSIQRLTKLQTLDILFCPELTKRYKQGIGEDWHLISHIPRVNIQGLIFHFKMIEVENAMED